MPDTQQCQATAKSTGEQCQNDAIEGGNVCYQHGGAAEQVQKKAQERLDEAADGAAATLVNMIDELQELVEDGKVPIKERHKYIKELRQYISDLLDRAGVPKAKRQEITGEDGGPVEFEEIAETMRQAKELA